MFRVTSRQISDSTAVNGHNDDNSNQQKDHMKDPKKTSKKDTKKGIKLRDLKPKKDAKGGALEVYIQTSGTKQGPATSSTSSARFKDEIKPMDKASEAILALKPVIFHYKKELDPDGIPQFGLVAEQVEKVNPDLVARDAKGKVYTVRYEAVNAMLLNEFLKEHRKVRDLESKFAAQQKNFESRQKLFETTAAQQQKEIAALASQIQKVTTQLATASPSRGGLETTKRAPQVVFNNQSSGAVQ